MRLRERSSPANVLRLCENHKRDFPLRPFVSAVGSETYKLAKFFKKTPCAVPYRDEIIYQEHFGLR